MIDLALAFYLIFILPGRHLWRSVRPPAASTRTLKQRYLITIRDIVLLLLVVLASCWWNGYSAASVGLGAPAAGIPLWCLIAASAAMAALLIGSAIHTHRMTPAKRAELRERYRNSGMPTNTDDLWLSFGLALAVGGGWELLYRGYLLLVLAPYTGIWGAVAIAGLAYGAAHGYQSPKQISLSIAMALGFAAAYVLSGSLWWLIVIHVVLPLSSALTSWQLQNES